MRFVVFALVVMKSLIRRKLWRQSVRRNEMIMTDWLANPRPNPRPDSRRNETLMR